MSAVSDKLKNIINSVLNAPKDDIEEKIDIIVKNTRLGKDEGVKVKRILDKISIDKSRPVEFQEVILPQHSQF